MSLNNLINPPKNSQQKLHQWQAIGCSIRPMGNYLKALGLLRIVPRIKGSWQGVNFAIESEQTPDEIIDYILNDYQPSAICTPWNGSSRFYRQMPDFMTAILASECDRFKRLKSVYQISQELIRESGFTKRPKNRQKTEFITLVRSKAKEQSWHDWLNIVSVPKIVIQKNGKTKQEYAYPGLTGGTGGAVGNKDLGATFAEALNCLYDLKTGIAKESARSLIKSSLLGLANEDLSIEKSLLTQFCPVNDYMRDISAAKGHSEYVQSGEKSTALCNPCDAVLIYEGLLTFSGASCRLENNAKEKTQANFSLAVDLAIGTADLATFTESKKRAEEIWLPLWNTPKTWDDVRADIFSPNRRRLPHQQITDTIDMAHALSKWSEANGIDRYLRYAFLPRKGNFNYAVAVGEFIPGAKETQDLAAPLRSFRLDCRRIARGDSATPTLKSAIFLLEKELIELASGNGSYLNCLIQLGVLEREISYSHILNLDGSYISALQPLKQQWVNRALAESKSTECRLGISLGSLRLRKRATKIRIDAKGKSVWVKDASLDWDRRSLVDNLINLQKTWLIERTQGYKPIPRKLATPSFADIDNFIRGNVDDRQIARVALGASICASVNREFLGGDLETLPPHYGIGAICQWGKTDDGENIGGQGLMLNALARGQPELAMKYGLQRLRSRNFYPCLTHLEGAPNAKRIAAATAFPLSDKQLESLQNYYLK